MRTILASLTGTPSDRTVLEASIVVARKFASHIDCLHVKFDPVSGLAVLGSRMSWEIADDENNRSARARRAFDEAARRSDVPICDAPNGASQPSLAWREVPGLDLNETPYHGQLHDLVVVGRDDGLVSSRLPEIVATVGRPVLIPAAKPSHEIGDHIAIAWKPGPEAARALTAATPLVSKAKKVSLILVSEGASLSAGAGRLPELAQVLRWFGVEAETISESSSEAGVGETIRSTAYNIGADLLVMGAYGHSRLQEFVLGGVTRTMIAACEIPQLLFH